MHAQAFFRCGSARSAAAASLCVRNCGSSTWRRRGFASTSGLVVPAGASIPGAISLVLADAVKALYPAAGGGAGASHAGGSPAKAPHSSSPSPSPPLSLPLDPEAAFPVTPASGKAGTGADYQTACATVVAKACGRPPAEVAAQLASALAASPLGPCMQVAVSTSSATHAGFVTVTLRDKWLFERAVAEARAPSSSSSPSPRVLVDFSSPNMGKELHVGHLRSAVIGDTLARTLEAQGCVVDRVSHVGDCGVPVALVLTALQDDDAAGAAAAAVGGTPTSPPLPSPAELSRLYERAKKASGADPQYAARVQTTLRLLQSALAVRGGPVSSSSSPPPTLDDKGARLLALWDRVCAASRAGYLPLLSRLGVTVPERGESAYAPLLAPLVDDLLARGVAVLGEDGAVVIFVDGPDKPPMIIRKRDGGFLYATIDLAALRARLSAGYDRVVYVTDAAQGPHFRQVFAAGVLAGWIGEDGANRVVAAAAAAGNGGGRRVSLEHAAFGVVTGEGGKKLSSRDGTDLTLRSLLDQGVDTVRAAMADLQRGHHEQGQALQQQQLAAAKRAAGGAGGTGTSETASSLASSSSTSLLPPGWQDLPPAEADAVAEAVATAAIRFFDLTHRRSSNYAFSYSRALALKGSTGPYLQYATTRLRGLRMQTGAALAIAPPRQQQQQQQQQHQGEVDVAAHWRALVRECEARAAAGGAVSASATRGPQERALALALVRLPEALAASSKALAPHILSEYAVDLAGRTHAAYDAARVLPEGAAAAGAGAATPEAWAVAASRLRLFAAADACLRRVFALLGVQPLERM
jgi:arginyl-tRNA synthetase